MDDVPAGPASPEPRRPSLSVVVPVCNGGSNFERCLRRLRDSSWTDYELIVVDDGSTDGSGQLARRMGAIVARHDTPLGPAAARNLGAKLARAPIVFFVDADVEVHHGTLRKGMDRFLADPGISAIFGSYDDKPAAPGLVSQFRNLLHHFVHQDGEFHEEARPAHTFWTGCGMIRREVFLDFGGFDPRLYPRPAIEDIELGYRLTRSGCRILLARDMQATHLKRWTLGEVIRTDIFQRGVPWMLLIKRSGTPESDLNVQASQKVSVVATGFLLLSAAAMTVWFGAAVGVGLGLAAIVGLNRGFYRFLLAHRGPGFALGALAVHLLYFTCCGLSVLIALYQWHFSGRVRMQRPSVRHERIDRPAQRVLRPSLARLARRLTRWTARSG